VILFSKECVETDIKAFSKLLAYLKDFDIDHSTMVIVQVKNKLGILSDLRDRSSLAKAIFRDPILEILLYYLANN
jgi:hypothetical protein